MNITYTELLINAFIFYGPIFNKNELANFWTYSNNNYLNISLSKEDNLKKYFKKIIKKNNENYYLNPKLKIELILVQLSNYRIDNIQNIFKQIKQNQEQFSIELGKQLIKKKN